MKANKSLSPMQLIIKSITCTIMVSYFPHSSSSKCISPSRNRSSGGFDGMFAFGNSVLDSGNNNYLIGSIAKLNYEPYGVDFALGPTGRFTNGKTIGDLLGDRLGLPLIPAFLDPKTKGSGIINGVSYASGGSGILEDTGSMLGGVLSMNQQIENFENVTLPDLESAVQGCTRQEILSRYLFLLAPGNNDIQLNHLLGSKNVSLEAFTMKLIPQISIQLERLFSMGARNFVVVSVNLLGCNPWIMEYTKSDGCNEQINEACKQFYTGLVSLADELKAKLPGSEFLIVNTFDIIFDIIKDPLPRGFENAKSACCELKSVNGLKLVCKGGGEVCSDRNKYVFFDSQHTMQAVNDIVVATAFASSNASRVYPFNIQQLIDPSLRA